MEALTGVNEFQSIDLSFDSSWQNRQNRGPLRVADVNKKDADPKNTDATGLNLTPEEKKKVQDMRQRDHEVRAHEQAHVAASGGVSVSGPTYSYRKGPDGKSYAVAGEVQIDTSEGKTPEETISKAQSIRAAANAPAQPSSTDKTVAAQATQMETQARAELTEEKKEEQTGGAHFAFAGQSAGNETLHSPSDIRADGPPRVERRPPGSENHGRGPYASQLDSPSQLTAGYLNGASYPSDPSQVDVQRAALAYQKNSPVFGLAMAGTGISLSI